MNCIVRAGVSLTGVAEWNYSLGNGSVLRLLGTDSVCLLDLTEARGAAVQGLSLDGAHLGQAIDGIATSAQDTESTKKSSGLRHARWRGSAE